MTGINIGDEGFVVDASVLAESLNLPEASVPSLMKQGKITSRCEKGVDADAGRWRLTFFYNGRALRLTVNESGEILTRASFDAPRPSGGSQTG